MKESEVPVSFQPTAVRGKWLKVKNLNNSARDSPAYQLKIFTMKSAKKGMQTSPFKKFSRLKT
jgi:hypothetical protein